MSKSNKANKATIHVKWSMHAVILSLTWFLILLISYINAVTFPRFNPSSGEILQFLRYHNIFLISQDFIDRFHEYDQEPLNQFERECNITYFVYLLIQLT